MALTTAKATAPVMVPVTRWMRASQVETDPSGRTARSATATAADAAPDARGAGAALVLSGAIRSSSTRGRVAAALY